MGGLRTIAGDVEGALEHVNVPSYVIDAQGIVRWINPAAEKLVGDVRGRQFTSVVVPEERRLARELFARKVAGTATTTQSDVVLFRKDGGRMTVEVSSVQLLEGQRVVGVFGQVVHRDPDAELRVTHPALTPRQTEVLRLLEQGRSTSQIAEELHLSRESVRNHVRHLLRALGVNSRLEAVAVARREHLAA
jgi:PAS domain S-box-containing protein